MITAHGEKPRPRNRFLAHTGECLLGSYGHDNTNARALSNHADRAAPDSRPLSGFSPIRASAFLSAINGGVSSGVLL